MKFNSVKKVHLESFKKIIYVLSKELQWCEDEEITEEQTQELNNSEDVNENQQSKEICKFLKWGKCLHGR